MGSMTTLMAMIVCLLRKIGRAMVIWTIRRSARSRLCLMPI